jgi:hypothetical protein
MRERYSRVRKGTSAVSGAFLSLLLSVFFAHSASAQEPGRLPALDGDGGAVTPPRTAFPEARDDGASHHGTSAPPLEHRSILLELDLLHAPPLGDSALLNELAPEEIAPGSLVSSYRGVQSLVVRRLLGYFRHLSSVSMQTRWEKSDESIFDMERSVRRETEDEADLRSGGRWWDRTWRQSLVPSRGGAPAEPTVIAVGQEVELFRFGEVSLTNEAQIRLGRLSLYLDDDRIYELVGQRARDAFLAATQAKARPDPNAARPAPTVPGQDPSKPVKTLVSEESRIDISIGLGEDDADVELERVLAGTERQRGRRTAGRFETPKGNLVTGEGWNLCAHPALGLRLPTSSDMTQAFSSVSIAFDVNLFPGETRQLWGLVSLRFQASPSGRTCSATLDFEVLRW